MQIRFKKLNFIVLKSSNFYFNYFFQSIYVFIPLNFSFRNQELTFSYKLLNFNRNKLKYYKLKIFSLRLK